MRKTRVECFCQVIETLMLRYSAYWLDKLHLANMDSRNLTMGAILSNSVEMVSLVTEKSVNWIQTWTQFLSKDSAALYQTVERSVSSNVSLSCNTIPGIDRLFKLSATQAI